ncbi:hypothetical protein D3C87_1628780 [compost metagenome]
MLHIRVVKKRIKVGPHQFFIHFQYLPGLGIWWQAKLFKKWCPVIMLSNQVFNQTIQPAKNLVDVAGMYIQVICNLCSAQVFETIAGYVPAQFLYQVALHCRFISFVFSHK